MKQKKVPSRKRRAIRRLLTALIVVILANQVFHTAYFLPVQVLRMQEELLGVGRTAVIQRQWEPRVADAHGTYTVYFAGNEHVTLLKGVQLSFLQGWTGDLIRVLDCSREAPLYAGQFWKSYRDGSAVGYLFGRVDDPAIQTVTISDGQQMLTIPREDFIEQDGRTYFLMRDQDELRFVKNRYRSAQAWDRSGTLIAEIPINLS